MEDKDHTVEQLVRRPCIPFCFGNGAIWLQAQADESQESREGIGKKGDDVHGQDGMGAAAGSTLGPGKPR